MLLLRNKVIDHLMSFKGSLRKQCIKHSRIVRVAGCAKPTFMHSVFTNFLLPGLELEMTRKSHLLTAIVCSLWIAFGGIPCPGSSLPTAPATGDQQVISQRLPTLVEEQDRKSVV